MICYSDMQWVRQQGSLFTASGIFPLVSTRSNGRKVSASCPRKVAPRKRGRAPPNNLLTPKILIHGLFESSFTLILLTPKSKHIVQHHKPRSNRINPLKHANSLHRQKIQTRLYTIRLSLAAKTGINICPDHPASLVLLLFLVRHHQA